MLAQMSDRGPTAPAWRSTATRSRTASTKLTLYSPVAGEDWRAVAAGDRRRGRLGAREPCGRRRARRRCRGRGPRPRDARRPAGDERRPRDRALQGRRPARGVRDDLRAREPARESRARPHADGDREPRHDRGLAPVLDGPRSLPRPQRLALEPQHAAACVAPRGDRVPDGERHRGRGRLPRVAAARGSDARAGARGLPRGSRRLLHVRGRHGRRFRRVARPDRLQARGARRDRRLGRDGVRVPRDRRASRAPTTRGCGSPSPASSTSGIGRRSRDATRSRPRSSTSRSRRCASSTSASTTSRSRARARRGGGSSTPRARTPSRAGSTPSSTSRSTGTSATTAPA